MERVWSGGSMALAVLLCVLTQVSPDSPLTFLGPLPNSESLSLFTSSLEVNAKHPLVKMFIVYLDMG